MKKKLIVSLLIGMLAQSYGSGQALMGLRYLEAGKATVIVNPGGGAYAGINLAGAFVLLKFYDPSDNIQYVSNTPAPGPNGVPYNAFVNRTRNGNYTYLFIEYSAGTHTLGPAWSGNSTFEVNTITFTGDVYGTTTVELAPDEDPFAISVLDSYFDPGTSEYIYGSDFFPPDPIITGYFSTALPVTLAAFEAVKEGPAASLNWSTTEETQSSHFEVQHSIDTRIWSAVGEVSSHGTSSVLKHYTFTHVMKPGRVNYYRLKMVDLDGSYTHSGIASLLDEGAVTAMTVYPNPIGKDKKEVSLKLTGLPAGGYTVVLRGITGKKILERELHWDGATSLSFQVGGLPAGIYLLKAGLEDRTFFSRLIVE